MVKKQWQKKSIGGAFLFFCKILETTSGKTNSILHRWFSSAVYEKYYRETYQNKRVILCDIEKEKLFKIR